MCSDCGNLDDGQSSGIYKIFPEDSLDGFDVYCDMETYQYKINL
jgi:hypothetical protein